MNEQSNTQLSRRQFLQGVVGVSLSATGLALLNGCGIVPAPTPTPKIYRIGFLSGSTAANA